MYCIRIKINHRKIVIRHDDNQHVGVRLKSGELRYYSWKGFTLDMVHPVKLDVDAFSLDENWNPRSATSKMPKWCELEKGEYLLGSYSDKFVSAILPFRIV